jgi:hypothetical protein
VKKLYYSIFAGIALALNAFGAQYVDDNAADVRLDANFLGGLNPLYNPSYTGQFDLTGYGFNPNTQDINSAVATFTLWDTPVLGGSEGYRITVDGITTASGGSFSGFITLGGAVTGTLLGNLNDDGILDYTVTATSGVFWLLDANLTAEATNSVPDGGTTLGLLGLGFLGIVYLRRKTVANQACD